MKENIKVEGMVCVGCENRIKNALCEIPGVKEVEADHHTKIVTVHMQEKIKKEILEEIIESIGFEIIKEKNDEKNNLID